MVSESTYKYLTSYYAEAARKAYKESYGDLGVLFLVGRKKIENE